MRSFGGHCDRSLVLSAANMFQRVGLALSMAGSVLSASFWCVDVHCACFVAFSLCQATLCFFLVSQFSSVLALFTFVPTTVLPTRCMRHWILSGLGALPWLDLCVWTELQLLLSCSVFGNTFLNAGLPWLGRVIVLEFVLVVPCLGLCDVCVLVVVSSP